MESKPSCICGDCWKDRKEPLPLEVPVVIQEICQYCSKNECVMLYNKKTCCMVCYKGFKTTQSPVRKRGNSTILSSVLSTKSVRKMESTLTKKAENLIKDIRGNSKALAGLKKTAVLYYTEKQSNKFPLTALIEKTKTPLLIFFTKKDSLHGAIWTISLQKKHKMQDSEIAIFESNSQGIQFYAVPGLSIGYENKVLNIGQPHVLSINFDNYTATLGHEQNVTLNQSTIDQVVDLKDLYVLKL